MLQVKGPRKNRLLHQQFKTYIQKQHSCISKNQLRGLLTANILKEKKDKNNLECP